ncbi:hypothetical protein Q6O01_004598 [Salmonella enterica]|nr:hypothetical protein [Salmonella enterica]
MVDNTDNLFDENGNIQDVFKDKTVEEIEALFPQLEPEQANPADELIESRIALQERIGKLNGLISEKDTYGFSDAVITAFKGELAELEGTLNEINNVLDPVPAAEHEIQIQQPSNEEHSLFNKRNAMFEKFDKDIDDLHAIDFKNMTNEELELFFEKEKKIKEDAISLAYSSIYDNKNHSINEIMESNYLRDHNINMIEVLTQRIEEERNLRKANNNIDYSELDSFTENSIPKVADHLISERNNIESGFYNLSNLIENKDALKLDEIFIKTIIENKNEASVKIKEMNDSIKSILNNKALSEMTNDELNEWEEIKRNAYSYTKEKISDELMTTENHINSTRLHNENEQNEKWYKDINDKIQEEKDKRDSDYNNAMRDIHQTLIKEHNENNEETEESKFTNEINQAIDNDETMVVKKASTLKSKIAQAKDRIASNNEPQSDKEYDNEMPWYKKIGDAVDYFRDSFKSSSNAKPVFLSEDKIYDIFGEEIDRIVNRSKSRIIHFKDKTSVLESAQEIRAKGKNFINISDKMTKLAKAKGWKSITFEGNNVFLSVAYERATRAGLVVEPQNAEQEELFKGIHKAKGLDEIMPFSGMKKEEVNNKEIDVPEVRATQGQRMRM